jgi:hypothetical protein
MKRPPPDEIFFEPRKKAKTIPHGFVLDALAPADPYTRPMFGCTAVYVEDKIVVILRDKPEPASDNGVWVATTVEHHASLREALPSLRSISVLGAGVTGWQLLPQDDPGFEEEAMRVVRMILARDPRIGKVPKPRRPRGAAPPKKKARARAKTKR